MTMNVGLQVGEPTTKSLAVPLFVGESYPSSVQYFPAGGVQVGGTAGVNTNLVAQGGVQTGGAADVVGFLNGVYDVQPWVAPTPTGGVQLGSGAGVAQWLGEDRSLGQGGVQVSGAAAVAQVVVHHWVHYCYGGVQVSGAGSDGFNWIHARTPAGGAQVSGTATVSTASVATGGTLAATLPSMTALLLPEGLAGTLPSMTATLGPEGNRAGATLPMITANLGPEVGSVGRLAAVLTTLAGELTALNGASGTVDAVLPTPLADVEGGAFQITAELPVLDVALVGNPAVAGTMDVSLPSMNGAMNALVAVVGVADDTLPALTATLDALAGTIGEVAANLSAVVGALTGAPGVLATVEVTLPSVGGYLDAHVTVFASFELALPAMQAELRASYVATQIATYVVNTITNATTTYESFNFNSFAEISGRYYAAGPSGLFELTGATDNGVPIAAHITTGQIHFGSEFQKRVSDFYAAMRSEGDLTLRVWVDENDPFEYVLSPLDVATLNQRRSLIGRGARGKYWKFGLANNDGADFDFDSFNVAAVPLSRRI